MISQEIPYDQFGSGIGSDFLPNPILLTGERGQCGKEKQQQHCKHCSLMDIILVGSTVLVTNPNHITGAAMLNIYSVQATANTSCALYLFQAPSFSLMVSGSFSWLTAIHVISGRETWRAFVSMQLLCEFHLCQMWFPRDSGESHTGIIPKVFLFISVTKD